MIPTLVRLRQEDSKLQANLNKKQKSKNQEFNEVFYMTSIRYELAFEYFIFYLPIVKLYLFV